MGLIDSDWDRAIHNESCKQNKQKIKQMQDIKQLKRKYDLTDYKISVMFGYKNKLSYANSSAKKRIENGLIAFYETITRVDCKKNKRK